MRVLLQKILKFLAQRLIFKYQPILIGVTGSLGKTSTKEAVYAVLSEHFVTRRTSKSYNNELGLPLTIIGQETQGKNIFGWLRVVLSALEQLLFLNKDFPEVLVLEMAADHPGDIKYLTQIAPCNIGVLTSVAPVHTEFFKKVENIKKEKLVILTHLKKDGSAIYNSDDDNLQNIPKVDAQVFTYGIDNQSARLRATDIQFEIDEQSGLEVVRGIKGKFKYNDSTVPFYLPGVLARHYVYAALAAAAVGICLDINLVKISESLKNFRSSKGRMNLLEGVRQSLIIDDSYNSSPQAAVAALRVLADFPRNQNSRKIAILGDMNELGDLSADAHFDLGKAVFENSIDLLITYGKLSRKINQGAEKEGMAKDKSKHFKNHQEIIDFIKSDIKKGDVILIKGSQTGVRLEKVVKGIMAHPELARELLVRQGAEWSDS